MFNGGYIMLDLRESSDKVLKQAYICANQDKPVLVYDANGKATFMNIASDGASGYILIGASSSVTIASDGTITAYSGDLESILDKNGSPRFIEGELATTTISGVTYSYSKWSLSGTHLMMVLAGVIADTTTIATASKLCDVNVPQWVLDKIYPVTLLGTRVSNQTAVLTAEDGTTQSLDIALRKISDTSVTIATNNNITLTAERYFRVQFDLLIDNE